MTLDQIRGEAYKTLRQLAGLSQVELASRIGITSAAISLRESGKSQVTIEAELALQMIYSEITREKAPTLTAADLQEKLDLSTAAAAFESSRRALNHRIQRQARRVADLQKELDSSTAANRKLHETLKYAHELVLRSEIVLEDILPECSKLMIDIENYKSRSIGQ